MCKDIVRSAHRRLSVTSSFGLLSPRSHKVLSGILFMFEEVCGLHASEEVRRICDC